MSQQDATITVNPAEETIEVGKTRIRFLVTGADSHGSVALFEVTIPAGAGLPAPPHSHDGYEETIYGVEGFSTWTVAGEVIDVGSGQALCIPRGAVHAFMNHGAADARVLATVSPGVLSPAYFREAAVMRRHGLTPAPPSASV
jgi:quercetin dioxygenase-like cupin family protein